MKGRSMKVIEEKNRCNVGEFPCDFEWGRIS